MKASSEYPDRLRDFSRRLRQPDADPPLGMPARIFALYREMMWASFAACLDDAFPESRRHLPADRWEAMIDDFLAQGSCPNPSFHKVPDAFLAFVLEHWNAYPELPEYLPALLHWEWLTLSLSIAATTDEDETEHKAVPDACLQLAPWARLQHYPFAVGNGAEAPEQRDCYLLIFRDRAGAVRSYELSLPEARLAAALADVPRDSSAAHALAFPDNTYTLESTQARLAEWHEAGILVLTSPSATLPSRP